MPEQVANQSQYKSIFNEPLLKTELLEQLREIEEEAEIESSHEMGREFGANAKHEGGLVEEIIKLFLDSTPDMVAEMIGLESFGEYRRLSEIAHKMKSSSGSLGLIRFSRLCQFIEDSAGNAEERDYRSLLLDLNRCFEESSIQILQWQLHLKVGEENDSDREAV